MRGDGLERERDLALDRVRHGAKGTFIQGTLTNSKNIKKASEEEIRVFHEAVVNDLPSPVPWTETIKAIAILEGIYASQETGQRIDLAGKMAGA